jgi:uncharacterized protein YabE (DUF348 family)
VKDFQFVVLDHDKIQDTVDAVISGTDTCDFCQKSPIKIVYRGWDDKVVSACADHEEIVLEMIERAK